MRYALLALFLLPVTAFATNWVPVVSQAHKSVGRLELTHDDSRGICSGVIVKVKDKLTTILTASHCVRHVATFEATFNDRPVTFVKNDDDTDLGLLTTPTVAGDKAIDLASAWPQTGEEIAVLGFPFGIMQLTAQFGHVALPLEEELQEFWIDANIIPGDSGGAIITPNNKLIGITSAYRSKGASHMGVAVPIHQIRAFLK